MSKNKKNEKINRAGVIPYYVDDNDTVQMMFMISSNSKYGGPDPQISKGKVDPDDKTYRDAAFREAKEELGLFKGNVINETYIGKFLGRTHVFICKINDPDMFGDTSYETERTVWMTAEQFDEDGRKLHQPVVKAAVREINRQENRK